MSRSVSQTDSDGRGRYRVGCVSRQPFEELSLCRNHWEALAERIVALLSDRDRARRMGTACCAQWWANDRYSAFNGCLSEILEFVAGSL